MAQEFKVGDIVQLKSGGPKMTVVEIAEDRYGVGDIKIWCTWFAGAKNERGWFPPSAIVMAPEEK
jgi:uncharacterized protein YodC (DUF2158 family)